ncbi:MAG: hypothetical protein RL385_6173 [Pseudomonadota bacterium]|jgi:hypothetical protein
MTHPIRLLLPALALLAACAEKREPYHFLDTPADHQRLGLTDTVEVKEDGRHTTPGSDEYEWWYLDGVAEDGTVVVVVFSDNWLPGTHARQVWIDVTPPGQPTKQTKFLTHDAGDFALDRADVKIGASRFAGDLAHYTIVVDPKDGQGLGCNLTLTRRVPSYRPGTGRFGSGEDFFAWVVPVPEGALSGTVTFDGKTVPFSGSGYHDHNWGNVPPNTLMRNWWWGRAEVNGRTVVMAELRPAEGLGDKPLPLLYIAGPEGVVTKVHGDAVRLMEDAPRSDEDPLHEEMRAGGVTLRTQAGTSVHFTRHARPLTSLDLLAHSGWLKRLAASALRKTPWYTRWQSAVTIEHEGASQKGEGTIEFFDLE